MNKLVIIIGALLLNGCATSTETYLPDGRLGYSINCSGAALSMNLCYEKAADICKNKGYDIVGVNETNQGYITNANTYSNAYGNAYVNPYYGGANYQANYQNSYSSVPVVNRYLMISCKTDNTRPLNQQGSSETIFQK